MEAAELEDFTSGFTSFYNSIGDEDESIPFS